MVDVHADVDDVDVEAGLGDRDRAQLHDELAWRRKSLLTSYVLWFLFGSVGVHKFYLGKSIAGVAYAALFLLGWGLAIGSILQSGVDWELPPEKIVEVLPQQTIAVASTGMLLVALLGLLYLSDLFTLPSQVRAHTAKVRSEILGRLRADAVHSPPQ